MTTNPLIAWIQENFKRLTIKSPAFFKVWKVILGIPVLIIALPNALQILNIHLPQIFNDYISDIVGWATTAAFLMTFLPTQSEAKAQDQNGTPIKQTDTEKNAFHSITGKKGFGKRNSQYQYTTSTGSCYTQSGYSCKMKQWVKNTAYNLIIIIGIALLICVIILVLYHLNSNV